MRKIISLLHFSNKLIISLQYIHNQIVTIALSNVGCVPNVTRRDEAWILCSVCELAEIL